MKIINELLKIIGIATLVSVVWQGLELLIVGKIIPDYVDTIIGIILSLSLYANLLIADWLRPAWKETTKNDKDVKNVT